MSFYMKFNTVKTSDGVGAACCFGFKKEVHSCKVWKTGPFSELEFKGGPTCYPFYLLDEKAIISCSICLADS
jgi:hypothetical protein